MIRRPVYPRPIGRAGTGAALGLLVLLLMLMLVLPGCGRIPGSDPLPRPIDVVASKVDALARTTSIAVVTGSLAARDPATEAALRARAETLLEQRGYATTGREQADATLELVHRVERVRKRSWSSDPDASGARLVERQEAVVTLRIVRREDEREQWKSEARTLLDDVPSAPDAVAHTFARLLEAGLDRLPERH